METINPNLTKDKENFNFSQVISACSSPAPSPRTPPAITPKSIIDSRSITFIHADPSSFKEVVQRLTGSSETTSKKHITGSTQYLPVPVKTTGLKRSPFKLYQRRKGIRNLKRIIPMRNGNKFFAPAATSTLSPSTLDMPGLTLSPVMPAIDERPSAEERAIAEKGFYLHPSPRSTPPPQLLPLFPVTSPSSTVSSRSP